MILQPTRLENERQAMITMTESYQGDKAIFIADRGYESYNLYEHIRHTGNYFLIRIKDGSSRLFRKLPKHGEYDKEINITFTKSQTNEAKENYDKHLWLAHTQKFDYLNSTRDTYQTSYRIARINIDGLKDKYEVLITNLPKSTISTSDIKELYRLRWEIEISFRHLKYSVNLNSLHSKRRDFIKQEIWAKLITFNISMIIISYIQKHKVSKANKRKYEYKINITNAMFLIIKSIRKGGIPPNLIDLIAKELLPIRSNRSYSRNTKPHSFVSFDYRYK